jgi:hypothetical protein
MLKTMLFTTPLCTLFAASLLLAQDNQDKRDDQKNQKTDSQPAKAASSSSRPAGVPAGAKEIQPYLFRYVDEKGKVWMYRQTPFGVSKWEYQPPPPTPAQTTNPVTVTDLGDSYRFESNSPTGVQKWERKKTELTSYEQDMVRKDVERRHANDDKSADTNSSAAAKPAEKKQ